jgi:hypothetical protein
MTIAQREKGRTGAAWCFLSFMVMLFFYFVAGDRGDDVFHLDAPAGLGNPNGLDAPLGIPG